MVAPTRQVLGLNPPPDHFQHMGILDDREVDGLLFEVERFLHLVLKPAGNLLEEVFSPIILVGADTLTTLRRLCQRCITRHIAKHYLGFFDACLQKIRKGKPEMKMALYAARLALTGTLVLQEGTVEAHLPTLNSHFALDFLDDWIALKTLEQSPSPRGNRQRVHRLNQMRQVYGAAARRSSLPDRPTGLDYPAIFDRRAPAHL
jgi:predicted nucleotidyltransferase